MNPNFIQLCQVDLNMKIKHAVDGVELIIAKCHELKKTTQD